MAQKVQIILEDDIDGGVADQTISFGFDGTSYEIDLSEVNAQKMRDALAPYLTHGRKVSARTTQRRGSRAGSGGNNGGSSAKEIRAWARENGHTVPERGRIPAEIREAYEAR